MNHRQFQIFVLLLLTLNFLLERELVLYCLTILVRHGEPLPDTVRVVKSRALCGWIHDELADVCVRINRLQGFLKLTHLQQLLWLSRVANGG